MPSKNLEIFLVGRDLSASKALKNLSAEAEKTSASAGKMGGSFKAGALVAAGAVVALAGEAIHLAAAYEQADTRLRVAVTNVGGNFKALQPQVHALDEKMVHLGFTGTEVESAMSGLVSATKNPTQSMHLMGLAADIARGRNISLADATNILIKVETGHVALLGRMGINTKDATGATISATEAVDRLSQMYGGQAQAATKTLSGRMQVLKAEGEDLAVKLGTVLIPVVKDAAGVLVTIADDAQAGAHWLAEHKTQVEALAIVMTGLLVPAALRAAGALGIAIYERFATAVWAGATRASALGGALKGLVSPAGLAGVGIGLVAAEIITMRGEEQRANAVTKELADAFNTLQPSSQKSVDALATLNAKMADATDTLNHYGSRWSQVLVGTLQLMTPFTKNAVLNAEDMAQGVNSAMDKMTVDAQNTGLAISQAIKIETPPRTTQSLTQYDDMINNLGTSLRKLADEKGLGPALAAGGQQATDAIGQLTYAYDHLGKQAARTMPYLMQLTGGNLAKMKLLSDAVQKAGDNTAKAFDGATSAVDNFSKGENLATFYKKTISASNTFIKNIRIATARGLDPHYVAQLLQAGPEKAGPILDQLVKGHGDRMVKLANDSEKALGKIEQQAVEYSRLTTLAVNQQNDKMTKDLSLAMRIDSAVMAEGTKATVSNVAHALKVSEGQIAAVGREFGITFAKSVAAGANVTIPLKITQSGSGANATVHVGPGRMEARARGGPTKRGTTYIIGEDGPELWTAPADGYVTPNSKALTPSMTAMGGGVAQRGGDTYYFTFPNYVGREEDLIRVVADGLRKRRLRGAAT